MQQIEINSDFIQRIKNLIIQGNDTELKQLLNQLYAADIAEIFEDVNLTEGTYLYRLLDNEISADVLVELDEDDREKLLASFTSKEIAEEIIENIESDDAADMIAELPDKKQEEVLAHIEDTEQVNDIVDLLTYEEGSAGSIMAKELISVNVIWTINQSIREMRKQAENVEKIYTIYVIDNKETLLGRLSLKKLLFAKNTPKTNIKEVYNSDELITVTPDIDVEEVAQIMEKYNLIVLPVVDADHILLGRITIDDVVEVIKEEAEKDYQMASGISEDVEHDDSVWDHTRARIPWLLIGMAGGLAAAQIIGIFDITKHPEMVIFIPLIAATGGNVGVQSAAIVVQGLANNTLKQNQTGKLLFKELGVGLFNGVLPSALLFIINQFFGRDIRLALSVSISLIAVITFAALFGTFIPLTLNKYKVDPAVATGPFITTINDVFGLVIYFTVTGMVYQYLV